MSSAEERKIAEAIILSSFRTVLQRMLQLLDEFEAGPPDVMTGPAKELVPHSCPPYPEASRSQCIACGHLQDNPGRCEQCGCVSLDEGFFH